MNASGIVSKFVDETNICGIETKICGVETKICGIPQLPEEVVKPCKIMTFNTLGQVHG